MVESGLPEWAVFLPAYGLLYRRWMRQAAKAAWVALGVISFAAGFFDLYRNMPGAKHAFSAVYHVSGVPEARPLQPPMCRNKPHCITLTQLASPLSPLAPQFLEWLERNAHVRLSLLATYLLSESVVFEAALRHGARAAGLARAAAAALLSPARAAVAALGAPLALLRAGIAALWCAWSQHRCFVDLLLRFARIVLTWLVLRAGWRCMPRRARAQRWGRRCCALRLR